MQITNISEAKAQLSSLIEKVLAGEIGGTFFRDWSCYGTS